MVDESLQQSKAKRAAVSLNMCVLLLSSQQRVHSAAIIRHYYCGTYTTTDCANQNQIAKNNNGDIRFLVPMGVLITIAPSNDRRNSVNTRHFSFQSKQYIRKYLCYKLFATAATFLEKTYLESEWNVFARAPTFFGKKVLGRRCVNYTSQVCRL